MSNETTLVPVAQKPPGNVYKTRNARLYSLAHRVVSKFKRELLEVWRTPTPFVAELQAWAARLRLAREYSKKAKHRNRVFATNPVTGRIMLERKVSQRTPQPLREEGYRAALSRPRTDPWSEATGEVVRRAYDNSRNAELVLSGAEGPLLP